ncbi:hypothetical protein LguiB_032773 [Lonicera macranthoides]
MPSMTHIQEEVTQIPEQEEHKSESEAINKEDDKVENKNEEIGSPRGVLEIPILTSESDQSSGGSTSEKLSSPPAEEEKAATEGGGGGGYNGLAWKSLMDSFKWRPTKKFPTIPLLVGYEASMKRNLRRKLGRNRSGEDSIDCGDFVVPKPSWSNFRFKDLVAATDNFSPDKMLGKGGHADVYKGCLPDGQIVAVKKITKTNKNDEDKVGDFLTELGIIAHINHPSCARLIGFSVENGLHLVLQFAPNGSLGSVLHGSAETMEWALRYKVAVGIAEGLQYLHFDCQRRIIHRDITASNILLMEDFKPQISDFGLAKWLPENWSHHVVSPIEGTFGYVQIRFYNLI